MKEYFAGGCGIFAIILIVGVALILLTVAGTALNLVTLPWQENLKREGYEHGQPYIDGQVAILTTQMNEWALQEAKIQANPDNEPLIQSAHTVQAAAINQMWIAHDNIPNDVRADVIPPDVQAFLYQHPRGSR